MATKTDEPKSAYDEIFEDILTPPNAKGPTMLDRAEIEKAASELMGQLFRFPHLHSDARAHVATALTDIAQRAFEQAALGTNPLSVNLVALKVPKEPADA